MDIAGVIWLLLTKKKEETMFKFKKNIHSVIISVMSVLFILTSHQSRAEDIDCDTIKNMFITSGGVIHDKPSMSTLKNAVHLYQVNKKLGLCIYPNLEVLTLPVGEYEEYSLGGPRVMTLSDRTIYRLANFEMQTALIAKSESMDIKIEKNGDSYYIIVSDQSEIH